MSDPTKVKAALREKLQKQYEFEIASQIPVNATRASYARMLDHCIQQNDGKIQNRWACVKTGAPVKARMVQRAVYQREGMVFEGVVPVAELFCGSCDKPPVTRGMDPVFADAIMTFSM